MPYLIAVSLVWAFSFGLIKGRLAGLDPAFISAARLGLALLVFLPFLRPKSLKLRPGLILLALGAVQFGVMYLAYNASFVHLAAHEVALFSLTTPIFVTLIADALEGTLRVRALAAALVAVIGTGVVVFNGRDLSPTLAGLALMQLSNLAFAIGQVGYKRFREKHPGRDRDGFGLLYLGGFLVALAAMATHDIDVTLNTSHLITLAYLGIIASGLGFFFWNVGATKVGAGTLAVMNNAKVPLAVACSLIFFGEHADMVRLAISLVLLTVAVLLAEKR
jgi:drug/metabolite transporter (DMT)-like permease